MSDTQVDRDIVMEMYGLTAEQFRVYELLAGLVDEALTQFERGYAVDVEQQMATLAKGFSP